MNTKRMKELRKRMKQPVAVSGSNIRYFTDVQDLGGILLVTKDTEFMIASDRELAETTGAANVVKPKHRSTMVFFDVLKKEKIKKIGADINAMPHGLFKKFQAKRINLVDFSKVLTEIREVKDADEIKAIKKSCTIADRAIGIAARSIKKEKTERQVRTDALEVLKECEAQAFDFIVASGSRALYTHCQPTERRIKKHDFVIVDLGVKVNGYCSDITRTFCLKPSKEQKQLYDLVLEAQDIAKKSIAIGRKQSVPAKKVESFFKKHKMLQYWKYSLGHGIGLDIHESPSISLDSKGKFRQNMTFTLEPGLHKQGLGGARVEDDYLMTKRGPTALTKYPKKLVP